MAEIEVAADVCIFASIQKIDVVAAPSVLLQSLKLPQAWEYANVVAHSDKSLHSLINSGSSNSSSGENAQVHTHTLLVLIIAVYVYISSISHS